MENTGNQGIISADNTEAVVDNSTQARDRKINESLEAAAKAKSEIKEEQVEKVEEKPEGKEEKQDDRFASKFAALSRREKALKAKEAEVEKKLKELEASKAPKQEEKAPEVPFEKRLKKDLFGTLKEVGFDLDTIIQVALNDGKMPREIEEKEKFEEFGSSLKGEIEALKKQLAEEKEAKEKERLEQESKSNEKVISDFKKDISKFIKENEKEFELVATEGEGMEDLVYEVITRNWEETKDPETGLGELLEIRAAVSQVEEHLLEQAKKYIQKQKIKQLVGESPTKKEQSGESKPASVTLSNTQSQTVTGQEKRLLSDEESLRNAAKLLRFK